MKPTLRTLLCILCLAVPSHGSAQTLMPWLITWDDLVPDMAPIENPYRNLSDDNRDDLVLIEQIQADLRLGLIKPDDPDIQRMEESKQRLRADGIDYAALEQAAKDIQAEIERRGHQVSKNLDGRVIRMPGYALPLESTDQGVREFLLVPYVGACIHTPPPPPNQIVYVQLEEAFKVESLYKPVWITGRLRIQASSRALSFVDGQAQIATGYTLAGTSVEPYR